MQMLERALIDEDAKSASFAVRALARATLERRCRESEAAIRQGASREQSHREDGLFRSVRFSAAPGVPLLDVCLTPKIHGQERRFGVSCMRGDGLGKINSAKAADSLNRAAGEKDVIVRNAVSRRDSRSDA